MSNNGSRLAVGAPNNYGYTGHMRVYQYNSGSGQWSVMGRDLDGDVAGGNAGRSVTISGDGSRVTIELHLVVPAPPRTQRAVC